MITRRLKTTWLIGATSLLLVVMLVAGFSLNYVITNFSGRSVRDTQILTANNASSVHPSADLLLNRNDWPTSATLFFDQEKQLYHIFNKSPQNVPMISLYQGVDYGDFQLSVTMQELHGPGDGCYYGVVFRSASDQSKYYLFEILTSSEEKDGKYAFWRYDGTWKSPLASGDAPALLTGSGKSNTLTVNAQGDHFTFSINQKSLGKPITDTAKSTLKPGQIGLYVETKGSEVAFSHLYVKPLK